MTTAADVVRPVVHDIFGGDPPVPVRFWDGSVLGPRDGRSTIVVRSPAALRRMIWAPGELGLARSYVAGDLDLEGDVYSMLDLRDALAGGEGDPRIGMTRAGWVQAVGAARRLGVIGPPLAPPPEEIRLRGRRHTKGRDAAAIAHHYDVSNDFYRLVLGPSLTYSCAYWREGVATLEDAQASKYELVARKLGLREGMRLLDVGCGWGGMVLHAAREHGVHAVGVTISRHQCDLARKRVAESGLTDRVEIRLCDYRDVVDGPYDAISSIGMFEHVGLDRLRDYAERLHGLLRPGGRLLNHAISRPAGPSGFAKNTFIDRYVFPDGELHEVGSVVSVLQESGFEARDVQSLREHYALTLRAWVANLEASWDEAIVLVGAGRARVWRLYMAASALNFEANRTSIHQVLGVKAHPDGTSDVPRTRRDWTDW